MDCPNCYTKGLSSRLMRCPRCDWLLVGGAPSGSSAAFPTPALSSPWAKSPDPELATLPSGPPAQEQLRQLWSLGGEERYRPGSAEQPAMDQNVPLRGKQRALLVFLALTSLMPVVVLSIAVVAFRPFFDLLWSALALLGWVSIGLWLFAAVLLATSLRRGVLALIDAIEGVGIQVVDRVSGYVAYQGPGKGSRVVLEKHGKLIGQARQRTPRIGEHYRVVYSSRMKLIFKLEPLHPPGTPPALERRR